MIVDIVLHTGFSLDKVLNRHQDMKQMLIHLVEALSHIIIVIDVSRIIFHIVIQCSFFHLVAREDILVLLHLIGIEVLLGLHIRLTSFRPDIGLCLFSLWVYSFI